MVCWGRATWQMAYADLTGTTSLGGTLPWATQEFEDTPEFMGDDFWRYGGEFARGGADVVSVSGNYASIMEGLNVGAPAREIEFRLED